MDSKPLPHPTYPDAGSLRLKLRPASGDMQPLRHQLSRKEWLIGILLMFLLAGASGVAFMVLRRLTDDRQRLRLDRLRALGSGTGWELPT